MKHIELYDYFMTVEGWSERHQERARVAIHVRALNWPEAQERMREKVCYFSQDSIRLVAAAGADVPRNLAA